MLRNSKLLGIKGNLKLNMVLSIKVLWEEKIKVIKTVENNVINKTI